jgi:pimeloyl-ACP methyl ester carboxylesterase
MSVRPNSTPTGLRRRPTRGSGLNRHYTLYLRPPTRNRAPRDDVITDSAVAACHASEVSVTADGVGDGPAGARLAWVMDALSTVAAGGDPPSAGEIAEQYTPAWLAEVPIGSWFFYEFAPAVGSAISSRAEPSCPNEARLVLRAPDGTCSRLRCLVEDAPPHRIRFQLFSPACDPAAVEERVIERDGRAVHVRDYGGDGPLLLLWHGSGCDATVWEAMVPHLGSFHVVAQDLPGHGRSQLSRLSVSEAMADADALVDALSLGDPLLVGHSLGGWLALHCAATRERCRGLVCLDGPTALDFAAMGLTSDHPGFLTDPPDVASDLERLGCPGLITLCAGDSDAEASWMIPFRRELADYISSHVASIRVEWERAGHMMVLSHAEQTAAIVTHFAGTIAG